MSKHKNKIIAAIVVIVMLSGAWFMGGVPTINHPTPPDEIRLNAEEYVPAHDEPEEGAYDSDDELTTSDTEEDASEEHEDEETEDEYEYEEVNEESAEEDDSEDQVEPCTPTEPSTFDIVPPVANPDRFAQTPEGVVVPDIDPANIQIFAADHPAMREPVEPENMVIGDEEFTVTISVRAHTILYNMHLLNRDKHELVPEDGWILPPTVVVAYEGESVFNVLQREMRRNRIHMVSRWTPIFNSAYVEAINNLYEFDVGPLSGWMYSVNGWFPNFGASRYLLSDGDVIEWVYTVDLGRDLGVLWLGGE